MELDLVKYIKTLLPHIDKSQVLEDLRITERELQSVVLPSYSDAASHFSKDKFKSKENNKIDSRILSLVKSSGYGRPTTFIGEFYTRLQNVEKNIDSLIKAIDSEISRDVITDGISSRKAVLIRVAEQFSFISRASMDLLNLIYMNEALEAKVDVGAISMSKPEIAKTEQAVDALARLLNGYGIDTREFEKNLDRTPDIILSRAGNKEIEAMYSDKDMDSMTHPGLVGFVMNPIYHIRMQIASWQVDRYKAAQEKKKTLELRLLHLQILREQNGTNPRLEQEISYTQGRVSRLAKRLQEDEADLEIAA